MFPNSVLLTTWYQEIDILLSSSIPSTLTAALPFVFVTQDLDVIPPSTVEKGQTPPNTSLTKLYWGAHVQELKQEFFTVKSMGTATLEEWLKGLDCRGKERWSDAARWENWAISSGGLKQMRSILYPGYKPPPAPLVDRTVTLPQIPGLGLSCDNSRAATPSAASSQRNGATPDPSRPSSTGTASLPPSRTERTKEQVAELKATRKAEIERRALELDPPLPAAILAQISSFQAALQMVTPMDDQAWETLKPRLLAQRREAEQRESENSSRTKREVEDKKSASTATKETRDAEDADWDEVQAPVRARIAGYADEIIRDGWEDGDKISRENCSRFAVEVLIYIRKRFYAEVAKDAAAARAAGKPPLQDPPQGPFTQKLTLENMKWIFDVKVKSHTERHRKEIFMCNGCDVTVRYYGFEGVIQHYAAKHTNALSIGNVVVAWRAEWPEVPPFTWEPKPAKNGSYQTQPPGTGYNAHVQTPHQPYRPPPPPGVPTPTLGYGAPSWNEPYGPPPQPPFPAATTAGYAPPPAYGATPYPADPYTAAPPAQGQPGAYPGAVPPGPPGQYSYNYGAYQSNSQVGYQAMQPAPFSAQYRSQLEEVARMARELWNATTNMKDKLSIVRVQVVVFHLAKRFHAKFGIPLSLATFIDGLSNHKDMRPVRNVNGLFCRVCYQGVGGYVASDEERKSYSLPQLTAHFQAKHVDPFAQMGQYGPPPEWTVDMVLLPEPSAIPNLRAAVSMDGQKYHLVNEAVPHLLGASGTSGTSQAATNTAPAWQDHGTYYQGYQGAAAVDGQPPYYEPPQPNVPQQDMTASQYQNHAVPPAQPPTQPPNSYNYSEPTPAAAMSMAPAPVYPPPEPAVTVSNVAPTGRGSDHEGRPSQNRQRQRKNKKKGGNVRDNDDAEAKKREEEEAKMAEEEAEREGDVIRAMWAADRAKAARKSAVPENDVPDTRSVGKTDNNSSSNTNIRSGKSSRPSSKPGTPQLRQQRFQSKPPRDSPRRSLDTLDTRVPPAAPTTQRDVGYRGHQLSNVTYMDGGRDSPSQRDGPVDTPGGYERYDRPASQRPVERRRSRSPVYIDLNRPPPASQYRQRTPPPQQPLGGDPGYHHPSSSNTRPPAIPLDDVRYERPPPHRDEYVPRDYAGPALIEYEIIEYRNPDGTTWIEERPLRRIPQSESERYYRDAAHAYPPPPPVSYDRGEPYPYRREHLAQPHHHSSPGPGARPREAYPPHQAHGLPYDAAPPSAYSSRVPPPPSPHQPPPASVAGGGAAAAPMYEYDPRRPSEAALPAPPSLRIAPPPPPPRNGGYYGETGGGGGQQQQGEDDGEDDYDPRFPAAPPGPAHGTGPAPRTTRYYG